ncbi:MAG TPA: TonB family protein, partial [Gammaproteobacteria bacterium]
ETLLFYHPAVHRISRSLRQEREQCCDDIAAGIGGNALAYARVLARLEEMRQRERAPALALGIAEQELFFRIQRLVGATRSGTSPDRWLPAMLIAFAAIASLGRAPDLGAPLLPALFEDVRMHQRVLLQLPPAVSRPFRPITGNATDADVRGTGTANSTPAVAASSDSPATERPGGKDMETEQRRTPVAQQEDLPLPVGPLLVNEGRTAAAADAQGAIIPRENAAAAKDAVLTGGQLLHAVEPVYPRRARRAGEEGHVLLEFTITPQGNVADIDVLEATPRGWFENAARDAIGQWRYQPFTENGEAVARRATQTLEFRLVDEPVRASGTPAGECKEQTGTRLCRAVDSDDTELRIVKN